MNRRRQFLSAISGLIAAAWVPQAWAVRGEIVVNIAPPPPPVEPVPPPRPGFIWVSGYWRWDGRRYVWVPGHWVRARPDYYWVEPVWVERHGRHHFHPGHWARH